MKQHRHIIIAGSNKCGTTSLFRYLAHHTGVQISTVKEAQFFRNAYRNDVDSTYSDYLSIFPAVDLSGKTLVEASPQYLHSEPQVARRIRDLVPDVQLIFMLRNPASRLHSAFRSQRGKVNWGARDTQYAEFVDLAISAETVAANALQPVQSACYHELRVGCYARHLENYFSIFSADQISIRFFDEFRSDVPGFMENLCNETGLAADAYSDYAFTIENRTRNHKSDQLRAIADKLNVRFEFILNRYPALRRAGRRLYDTVNTQAPDNDADPVSTGKVDDYYAGKNLDLARLLARHKPDLALPAWISAPESRAAEGF